MGVTPMKRDQLASVCDKNLREGLRGPTAQCFGKHCNGKRLQQEVDGRLCSDSWDARRP
jgi:hypothetical protein